MTKRLKIAVYFDQEITTGGGYQQALSAILLFSKIPNEIAEKYYFTNTDSNISILSVHNISAQKICLSKFKHLALKLRRGIRSSKILRYLYRLVGPNSFEKIFISNEIDLIYFISSNPLAKDLEKINYITTIWDLSHRDEIEFPEVREFRVFEERESLYREILPKAVAVLVDSEIGKKRIIHRYGLDPHRIVVMPFNIPLSVTVKQDELDPNFNNGVFMSKLPYIFYPAQFWPHKNHIYILNALKILKEKFNINLNAVFVGGDKGNLNYIKIYAKNIKVDKSIYFLGFVSNNELAYLYKGALALVMPTYFGPTNLPPLEAFSLGIPVLYGDHGGLKEQVGNAALLLDLTNPECLANHLMKMLANPELIENLVINGLSRIKEIDKEPRLEPLIKIIKHFAVVRSCWQ
jgi:glycosyltransferase involved in cell wall biosynthesis